MYKILPLISTVLLILTLSVEGFVAWKFSSSNESVEAVAEQSRDVAEPDNEVVFMGLGETTVNLSGGASENKFLRVKIIVALNGIKAQERITENITKVTDLVLNILSSQTFSYVRTPEGKMYLKRNLIERVNRLVGRNPVRDVFFTDFVSQ